VKVLLDTNIFIHRETRYPIREDIGLLFKWLEKLKYEKFIHPVTINEINKYQDDQERRAFQIKLKSYTQIPIKPRWEKEIEEISKKYDKTENDRNDTALLNEVFRGYVDILITEDKNIHQKAKELGIEDKVFTIEEFLEKAIQENPELIDYKIPIVEQTYFGNLDLNDKFFDSFKEDYKDYESWFRRKAYEKVYACKSGEKIVALLYLKREGKNEPYDDIKPKLSPKNRLKIGSFKVELHGHKLGERLLKIVFDNALNLRVDEIYVTIFDKREEQKRLISLLQDYGFYLHGTKETASGIENVYVRDFSRKTDLSNPKKTFPYMSKRARKFLVPIWPQYHTTLFPDSILRTESPMNFVEQEPHRNAISKVYVSRSIRRDMRPGDILVFYRTAETKAYYKSVITTLGIVEQVITGISSLDRLISICRKRTALSDEELKQFWNKSPRNPPFVVYFLYAYSLPKRLNLKRLIELGIIKDIKSAPRGFEEINDTSFNTIIRESHANANIIVD
jgi:predicted nucleic acid-binding protein